VPESSKRRAQNPGADYLFGPMNSSILATSAFLETYTVFGANVQGNPRRSHASQKIRRMSSERLLNE
jgi:hypothetical protein